MGHVVDLKNIKGDVFDRTNTLVRYCNDIKKFQILTQEQEDTLFNVICDVTSTELERELAKDKIINCNQRFVLAVAKRFATNDTLCDLIEEGNIGLIKGLNEYIKLIKSNGNKMYRFISIAVWYIKREINIYLINNGKQIRRSNSSKTYHTMAQAINKFYQEEQRNPTSEELLDILNNEYGTNIKDTCDLAELSITSINEYYGDDSDNDTLEDSSLFSMKSASYNDYENEAEKEQTRFIAHKLLSKLTERDREILKYYYGIQYGDSFTYEEIAKKFNITKERVRQIIKENIKKLKTSYSK